MTRSTLVPAALLALAIALPAHAAGPAFTAPDPTNRGAISPIGTSTEFAVVEIGSSAPDFAYEAVTGGWSRLRDLREQGHVLLVVGAGDEQLAALQSERAKLLSLGVVPVAVLDVRPGRCRSLARRIGFECTMVPDPRHVVASQLNAHDSVTGSDVPAWFVIDRTGRVRGMGRAAWPHGTWAQVATDALGLAKDDVKPADYPKR